MLFKVTRFHLIVDQEKQIKREQRKEIECIEKLLYTIIDKIFSCSLSGIM